jgi:hypothetical protein
MTRQQLEKMEAKAKEARKAYNALESACQAKTDLQGVKKVTNVDFKVIRVSDGSWGSTEGELGYGRSSLTAQNLGVTDSYFESIMYESTVLALDNIIKKLREQFEAIKEID